MIRARCSTCRYWSERIAESIGGAPMTALCLSERGPMARTMREGEDSCPEWASGHCGAVDDPSLESNPYEGESI